MCWPYVVLCEDVEIFIVPRCGSFVVLFEDFDLNSSIVLWCGDFVFFSNFRIYVGPVLWCVKTLTSLKFPCV